MVFSRHLTALGDFGQFSGEVLRAIFRRRFTGRSVLRQMDRVGVESLTVVTLCAFFIGLMYRRLQPVW